MCVAAIAWQCAPGRPLVLVANRDEYFDRPTAAAEFWPGTDLLAGRDLASPDEASTWLGITRGGRFALLTNLRQASEVRPDAPSRGPLVARYLAGQISASDYATQVHAKRERYNGFNLLIGQLETNHTAADCWYVHSKHEAPLHLPPGIYGLSNAALDTPWPKVQKLVGGFTISLAQHRDSIQLLSPLFDAKQAPLSLLPQTGVSLEWERALSAIFIRTARYGTRASTVIDVQREHTYVIERSWQAPCPSDQASLLESPTFSDRSFYFENSLSGQTR